MRLFDNPNSTAGKMTVSIMIVGFVVFAIAFLFDFENERATHVAQAQQNATTSVNVLNTPPVWTQNAEEAPESSTSSPTNATSSVEWTGIGTDSNAEDYFLIICDSAAAATPVANAPPTCAGGTWGVSPTTTSGSVATATYATLVGDSEVNDWWASICDFNAATPRCNTDIQQGSGSTQSPFHVNHRPTFTAFTNDGAGDPGDTVTWTMLASDSDTLSSDTVQLFVCTTADFDYATPECGGGFANTWGTSSLYASDPQASTTITIPTQDDSYAAYGFVLDNHGYGALEEVGGTSSPLVVNNVAPTISVGDIFLNEGSDITLTTPQGETTGFIVRFEFADDNSCVANASTTKEFNAGFVSVFRTGIGSSTCDTAGEYDANNCYNTDVSTDLWAFTALTATDTEICTGPTDRTEDYELVFPLWYVAEPTDGADLTASTWFADNWSAMVQVSDDDLASSTYATNTVANAVELLPLAAFNLATTSIPYGSVEPGNTTTPITATTTIEAIGNVGVDQDLDGEDMCTYYSGFDTCFDPSPSDATSTIVVGQQVYATSSVAYSDPGVTALSAAATELEVDVPKTTVTTTPATADIIWGIAVPATINTSGAYTGQNTFQVVQGEAQQW